MISKLRLAATAVAAAAAATASALVLTPAGVSSAAQAHRAAAPIAATLTATQEVFIGSASCPASLPGLEEVACLTGADASLLAQAAALVSEDFPGSISGYIWGSSTANGVITTTLSIDLVIPESSGSAFG